MKKNNNRVYLIDEIRAFAIICMVVYHIFFDLVYCFNINIQAFHSKTLYFIVDIFVFIFVFISGSACAFSRNNLKRGLICLGIGLIITLVTYLFIKDMFVAFGILHMLGICMILYAIFNKLINKCNPWLLILICIILFFITFNVELGFLGFKNIAYINLPKILYDIKFLFFLGFTSINFKSSDYFALFPWLFCFIAGSSFGRLLKEEKMPKFFYNLHSKPLAFIGRHTLIIYILHQPVIFILLKIIFIIF